MPMKIDYSKIIINIPKKLLEEFDNVSTANNYSRAEAIKEAMRQFIIEQTPEDYVPQQMRKIYMESAQDAGAGLVKGMVKAASDPEMQRIQQQNAEAGLKAGIAVGISERLQQQNVSQPQPLSQAKPSQKKKKKYPPNKEDFERAKKKYPNKWKKNLT